MMSQRDAVFSAVVAVVGEVTGKVELSKDQAKLVHQLVFQAFKTGQVELKDADKRDDKWLAKYIPGLVNNWVRKDLRLNGNTPYVAKNPGSRQGSGDDSIKNMKALLSMTADPEEKKLIQAEIDKRKAELKPVVTVDFSKLPESLQHLMPTVRKASSS